MKLLLRAALAAIGLGSSLAVAQGYNTNISEVFEEPGQSNTRQGDSSFGVEMIDPYTGALKIVVTDLVIPSNGGLDLAVVRNYQSFQKFGILQPERNYQKGRTTTGAGWDLHYGRLWKGNSSAAPGLPVGTCTQGLANVTSRDNPVLELPDGSRQLFAHRNSSSDPYAYIAPSRWILRCLPNNPSLYPDGGAIAVSPEGVQYFMTFWYRVADGPIGDPNNSEYAYHVTRIEHPNGTYITINYSPRTSSAYASLTSVQHSEGQSISFQYDDINVIQRARLTRFYWTPGSGQGGTRTWILSYSQIANTTANYWYKLDSVQRPDDRLTRYWYVDKPGSGAMPAGVFSLRKLTAPLGGDVEYEYKQQVFMRRDTPDNISVPPPQYVIDRKTIRRDGSSISGRWDYDYDPAQIGETYDFTYVKGPNACLAYKHETWPTAANSKWRMGLLIEQSTHDATTAETCGSGALRRETLTWVGTEVATQDMFRPPGFSDNATYAPRMSQRVVNQDGTNYTTEFNDPDTYGNPREIVETGRQPTSTGEGTSSVTRTTDLSYFTHTSSWIINRLEDETVNNAGMTYATPTSAPSLSDYVVARDFYTSSGKIGLVRIETRAGVTTDFDYYTDSEKGGEISTITDANGIPTPTVGDYTTFFYDYKRGTPRRTRRSIDGTETNVKEETVAVNDSGTIASRTDAELRTTSYGYNLVNLVSSITTPKTTDSDVSISRTSQNTNDVIQRGIYREVRQYDGFGMLTRTDWYENPNTSTSLLFQRIEYDADGRVYRRYLPGSNTAYVEFEYDALNRLTRMRHPDGIYVRHEYLANNIVRTTDERGFQTRTTFRSFGEPAERELMRIIAPRGDDTASALTQTTLIERDLIGQPTRITQEAVVREFRYNTNFRSFAEIHPETGTTLMTYDNAGNLMTRSVGSSGDTVYSYDRLYRLDTVTFPAATPPMVGSPVVDFDYYKDGRMWRVTKGQARWTYTYDANDNLSNELLELTASADFPQARNYTYVFGFNDRDANTTIRYPSGLEIDYEPNVFGRPTKILAKQDGTGISSFVTSINHHPNGQLNTFTLGNGIGVQYTQDGRLRAQDFTATGMRDGLSASFVNRRYGYDTASNVSSITDYLASANSKSMSYDGLNRLRTANGRWGTGAITYHPNDNIDTMSFSGSAAVPAQSATMGYDAATNRLTGVTGTTQRSGYAYDAYGNVTSNGESGAGKFTFDKASLLRTVNNNSDNQLKFDYVYDGNSRIVREYSAQTQSNRYKATSSIGSMLFEEDLENSFTRDHIFVRDRLVATRMRCTSATDTDGDGVSNCVEAKYGMVRTVNDANSDADQDGVTNIVEINSGSNINKSDTDGDGLNDRYEIENGLAAYLANSNSDTDGDTLSNMAEYQLGTRPNDADSDNDGIPDNLDPKPLFNPAWLIPIYELLLGS